MKDISVLIKEVGSLRIVEEQSCILDAELSWTG